MTTSDQEAYYVAKTLEEMQTQVKELYDIHHAAQLEIGKSIERLEVKSGIWYTLAGAIPGVAAILLMLFKGLL
jgi:hypothetical protein